MCQKRISVVISLFADGCGGSFVTKPLTFTDDTFYPNYATSAYGGIAVTVLNDDGTVFSELPELYGNELSHSVHVEGLAGRKGRISMRLYEAHLYAMGSGM